MQNTLKWKGNWQRAASSLIRLSVKGCDSLEKVRNRLIYLHRIPLLTRRMLYTFLQHDIQLTTPFKATPSQLSDLLSIHFEKAVRLHQLLHNRKISELIRADKNTCDCITIFDEEYPSLLRSLYDPPLVLYAQGDISLMNEMKSIAIIGTRNPSAESQAKVNRFVTPLVRDGWTIVSGLAYGIDSQAHEQTLRERGKTIAVLGSGFHHVYPKRHLSLYRQIREKGLVLSEYPPNIRPQKYHFPERNRIISGLSQAVLVIEATEKSGTLITVDQALEQGREIYVAPGSLLYPQTVGCHKLIQQGAKLVIDANDILEDFPFSHGKIM